MAKTVTLVTPGSAAHYSQSNINSNFSALNTNFSSFLHLRGSKEASNAMTGPLDFGGYKGVNSATPTNPSDLVTKAYADGLSLITIPDSATPNTLIDADGDTYIKLEVAADDDTVRLAAGTSGGAAEALQVIGDDTAASSSSNPYVKLLKYLEVGDDIRIEDDDGDSYIVVSPTGGEDDHITFTAGGTKLLVISGADSRVEVADNLQFTVVNKGITDIDADTGILLEKTSDDDTIRLKAGGTETVLVTSTLARSDLVTGFGGVTAVPTGVTKALIVAEGTSATAASDQTDATVIIWAEDAGSAYAGESVLRMDFRSGASSRSRLILGRDSTFPEDVAIGANLAVTGTVAVSDTTDSSSASTGSVVLSGGMGIAKKLYVGTDLHVVGDIADGTTHATGGTATFQASGVIHQNTTPVGNVGAGEDTLMSYTLPANTLSANGDSLRITALFHGNGIDNQTVKFHFGATSMTCVNIGTLPTTVGSMRIEVEVIRLAAGQQVMFMNEIVPTTVEDYNLDDTALETESGTITIKFTGENTSDTSNDAIVQDYMRIEFLG